MDTPLHAAAVPDADPATLKRPRDAAREIVDASIASARARARRIAPEERAHDGRHRAGAAAARRAPARRRCARPHQPPAAQPRLPTLLGPATWSSPTTPRRCRRASPAATSPSGAAIEVRLAGRRSLAADDVATLPRRRLRRRRLAHAHRGPAAAAAARAPATRSRSGRSRRPSFASLGHPRLVELRFDGDADAIWAGLARHGRPVQYAHVAEPLALWDVWTPIAAQPVAFEPPSAGFVLDWRLLDRLARARRRLRDAHARGRPVVDRRRRARRAPAVRRAVPHAGGDGRRDATRDATRRPRRRGRHDGRARARARGARGRAACAPAPAVADQPARPTTRLARRRRARQRHARARARATTSCCARSSTTRRSRGSTPRSSRRRLPHARVRRLGADRARRRAACATPRRART